MDVSARKDAWRSEPNLQELCENNGISEEQFVQRAHLTQQLDLFMGTCDNLSR